ncbi:MAG TPA: DNA repair protein RadA, partial [Myxococcales bacterium]|nr:DNA repair protein RadA [Myxococcales bacterium]
MGITRALAKIKIEHVCQSCGYRTPRWLGRCPGCDAWASLVEEQVSGAFGVKRAGMAPAAARPTAIDRVELEKGERDRTGIGELDRALGGGLVP